MSYIDKNFLENIAFGSYSNITPFSKIGFSPFIGTTNAATISDLWSYGGRYTFPTAATAMSVVSSSAGDEDLGTLLHSGTSNGGSTTTLELTGENFATGTAIGDLVILDKAGTTPEWGYVSAVTSNTKLTCAGGFSSGGTGSGRVFEVIDVSVKTGVHAVKIGYLDTAYASHEEIVVLNGNAEVAMTGTPLRANSFRAISYGTNLGAVGNLSLKASTPATQVYSYITALYSRARNVMYTVPAGKTLYVVSCSMSYGCAANQANYARMSIRANIVDQTSFVMGNTFWPYTEIVCSNNGIELHFPIHAKLPAKTDIKISGTATAVGQATSVIRGYLLS